MSLGESCNSNGSHYGAAINTDYSYNHLLNNLPKRSPQPTPPGLNQDSENNGSPSKARQRNGAIHSLMVVAPAADNDGHYRFVRSCRVQGVEQNNIQDISVQDFAQMTASEGSVALILPESADAVMLADPIELLAKFRAQTNPLVVPEGDSAFAMLGYTNEIVKLIASHPDQSAWRDVIAQAVVDHVAQPDTTHGIFLDLTTHGDLYSGDIRYFQPFDDVDDLRVLDDNARALPCVMHGTDAGVRQLDQVANYMPMRWSDTDGCIACKERDTLAERVDSMNVHIVLSIDAKSPFFDMMLESLANQDLAKDHVAITALLAPSDRAHVYRKQWKAFVSTHSTFAQTQLMDMASYADGAHEALAQQLPFEADRVVLLHSHAMLTNTSALRMLMSSDYGVLSPLLSKQNQYWSNFWGTASGYHPAPMRQALSTVAKDLAYMRSPDYFEIVERKQTGVWTVPLAFELLVIQSRLVPLVKDAFMQAKAVAREGTSTVSWFTVQTALCLHLRSYGMHTHVTNVHHYGHLLNADEFDATKVHPDFYMVRENPKEWEQRYLNEHYHEYKEHGFIPGCNDVFKVPIFSKQYAQALIDECEHFGEWSNGQHGDNRLKGGYEPVPTQDIHLNQIGFDKSWYHIITTYLRPITSHWYTGYTLEGRVTLDFVVRYRPDRQASLRPHHDASTVTLNVALNQGGVDYQGGGTHFTRQNCTLLDTEPGWGSLSPGRLTHQHEGLETTAGTRYILVSFIDQ
eukprot:TRINITY_DN9919_c0_g1_i1.p1 TRINITY_DN9919_c0_g1~~TRINITY_DN9919_c0_g1_i1.p1  ORF type:complete len:743 (+),score=187.34 TRINITY_DN9919_c0_g1_i1:176-2404(+)